MTVDDDSIDDSEATQSTGRRLSFGSPRFARLVQSPTARRFAPRRLAIALSVGGLVAWGLVAGGVRVAAGLSEWVASRPEHQIPFDSIELIPPPPAFIRSETAGILDAVRAEARYGPTLPVLATDLEELRLALSRNPWIESARPVRASYRHIDAHVTYRKPLALLIYDVSKLDAVLVDRNGVEMPSSLPFQWAEKKEPRYRLSGDACPLLEIHGLGPGVPDRIGLVWKPVDAEKVPQSKVLEAVRLAEFLQNRVGSKTPGGFPFPTFIRIHYEWAMRPDGPRSGFFLKDDQRNWIFWDSGPGVEIRDEPSATEKWAMLGQFIDSHRGLDLGGHAQDSLNFGPRGPRVYHPPTRATDRL